MESKWQVMGRVSAVGIEIAACIGIGAVGGYFADKKWGFYPYGTLLGILFGVAAAAKALWRVAKRGVV